MLDQDGRSPSKLNHLESSHQYEQQPQCSSRDSRQSLPSVQSLPFTPPQHVIVQSQYELPSYTQSNIREQTPTSLLTTHSIGPTNTFPEKDISRRNSSIYTYNLNQYSGSTNKTSEPSSVSHTDSLYRPLYANQQPSIDANCDGRHPKQSLSNTADKVGQYVQQGYFHNTKNSEDWLPKSDFRAVSLTEYPNNYHCNLLKKECENNSHSLPNKLMNTNKVSETRPLQQELDQSTCSSTHHQYSSQQQPIPLISNHQNNNNMMKSNLNQCMDGVNSTSPPLNSYSNNVVHHGQQHHYMSKNQSPTYDKRMSLTNMNSHLTTTSSCTSTTTNINNNNIKSNNSYALPPSSHHATQQHQQTHMYHPPHSPTTTTTTTGTSSSNHSSSGAEENSTMNDKAQNSQTKTSKNKVKAPRKKYRRSLCIEERDLLRVLHLPQTQACSSLGCSLSTLKRRFYELKDKIGIEKWPQFYNDIRHLDAFPHIYPMSLEFVLNDEPAHEKYISSTCMHVLSKAFECSAISKPSQKGYSKLVFASSPAGISKKKKK